MNFEKDKFYKYTPSDANYYYLGMAHDSCRLIVFCKITAVRIGVIYTGPVFITDRHRKENCKLISKKEVLEEIQDVQSSLRDDIRNILLKLDVSEQIDDILSKLEKYDNMG